MDNCEHARSDCGAVPDRFRPVRVCFLNHTSAARGWCGGRGVLQSHRWIPVRHDGSGHPAAVRSARRRARLAQSNGCNKHRIACWRHREDLYKSRMALPLAIEIAAAHCADIRSRASERGVTKRSIGNPAFRAGPGRQQTLRQRGMVHTTVLDPNTARFSSAAGICILRRLPREQALGFLCRTCPNESDALRGSRRIGAKPPSVPEHRRPSLPKTAAHCPGLCTRKCRPHHFAQRWTPGIVNLCADAGSSSTDRRGVNEAKRLTRCTMSVQSTYSLGARSRATETGGGPGGSLCPVSTDSHEGGKRAIGTNGSCSRS